MNFGSILSGAKNFLGGVGKNISNAVGGVVKNLTQPAPVKPKTNGLLSQLTQQASSFLNPNVSPTRSKTNGAISNMVGSVFNPQANAQLPPPVVPTPQKQITFADKKPLQTITSNYNPTAAPTAPSAFAGSSLQDAATKFSQDRINSQAQMVAPKYQAIADYYASRKPYDQVYQEQQQAQGIPDKQKLLSGLESDILKQQDQLETLPKEDIARRSDTGMLTEAARRRVQAMEERPIREQLLKTAQAQQGAEVGYNRATQLAREGAQAYSQATEEGARPLQTALQAAQEQYGVVADGIAQQLTGFTQDHENALRQYEAAQAQGAQLSQQQAQQAQQLKAQEAEYTKTVQITGNLTQEVNQGATLQQMMSKYLALGLDPDTILSLYNSGPRGAAKESGSFLSSTYGVSPGRFGIAQ